MADFDNDPKQLWLRELAGDWAEMPNPYKPGSQNHRTYERFRANLIGRIGFRGLVRVGELDTEPTRAVS